MWRLLRPFRDDGIPFRRQAPIGSYVTDFAWLGGKLLIEIDGGQHNEAAGLSRDAERTSWLERQSFEVTAQDVSKLSRKRFHGDEG